jgi:hypothetical protein
MILRATIILSALALGVTGACAKGASAFKSSRVRRRSIQGPAASLEGCRPTPSQLLKRVNRPKRGERLLALAYL